MPAHRSSTETSACALINWDESSKPTTLLSEESAEGVQRILNRAFPQLEGGITLDSARQVRLSVRGWVDVARVRVHVCRCWCSRVHTHLSARLGSVRQFLEQRPAVNYVNKLSRYHDAASSIVVVGDAAHCTGGASGQGCNSALEDAATLAGG